MKKSTPPGKLLPLPYEVSKDVKEVAEKVLNNLTVHANIEYVVSSKKSKWLGKCQLIPAIFKMLTGLDYIIYVNADGWDSLNYKQKEALIFHELEHIGWKQNVKDPEFGKWSTRRHDMEEFNSVVQRYGRWLGDVTMFDNSLKSFDNEFEETDGEIISKETGEVFYTNKEDIEKIIERDSQKEFVKMVNGSKKFFELNLEEAKETV
ncbi:putative metallopeptidase [bacterium]|nr:putative metallopeptidase [bacterium]